MIHDHEDTKKAILGVYLEGKTLIVGKVKDSKIEKHITKTINNLGTEENILMELISTIEEIFDKDIVGIGIGVPSVVDVVNGIVYNALNIPEWREVHLRDILVGKFGVSTYVNNDANCFAVGEKYYGSAIKHNNIVGLVIGEGLGSGIILNGQLYSGLNCGAGEFGSIPYKDHDYEYYCNTGYFDLKYGVKYDTLIDRAKIKNKIALAVFEQFGVDLGNTIKTILYSIDPEMIVIGGQIAKAYNYFEKSMWKTVRAFPYEKTIENLLIVCSKQENIALLGAAALYLDARKKIIN